MFEKHEIWERCEEYILVHVIFRDLETNLYHLQQTNYLYPGTSASIQEAMACHDFYVVDVFWENLPTEREKGYATMHEAIEEHWRDFGGD